MTCHLFRFAENSGGLAVNASDVLLAPEFFHAIRAEIREERFQLCLAAYGPQRCSSAHRATPRTERDARYRTS